MTEQSWLDERDKLSKLIKAAGKEHETNEWSSHSYDREWKVTNRRNEVWLNKKTENSGQDE